MDFWTPCLPRPRNMARLFRSATIRTGTWMNFEGGAGRVLCQRGGQDRKPHRGPDREIPSVRAYLKAQRGRRARVSLIRWSAPVPLSVRH